MLPLLYALPSSLLCVHVYTYFNMLLCHHCACLPHPSLLCNLLFCVMSLWHAAVAFHCHVSVPLSLCLFTYCQHTCCIVLFALLLLCSCLANCCACHLLPSALLFTLPSSCFYAYFSYVCPHTPACHFTFPCTTPSACLVPFLFILPFWLAGPGGFELFPKGGRQWAFPTAVPTPFSLTTCPTPTCQLHT